MPAFNPPSIYSIKYVTDVFQLMQANRFALFSTYLPKTTQTDPAAILLARLLERGNDAMKRDFMRIIDGELPQYDVVLRDKATGQLIDPSTGKPV